MNKLSFDMSELIQHYIDKVEIRFNIYLVNIYDCCVYYEIVSCFYGLGLIC